MAKLFLAVGSTNPVKVEAARLAAEPGWPGVVAKGFETKSGVSEQPKGDEETRQGAINRAKAALAAGQKEVEPDQEVIAIGLEGGVVDQYDGTLWSTVWAVVVDSTGKTFEANGGRIQVPEVMATLIRSGQEMGPVVAQLTGIEDVRTKNGMFGVVTNNYVTRTEEYASVAKMALGVYFGRDWDKKLS